MATFDDFDGVSFSIQAIRMYHNLPDVEFVVLDNNPDGAHGKAVKQFLQDIPNHKYVEVRDRKGSWVKYLAAQHASPDRDIVLVLDCHVLLVPGFFDALFTFWENNPRSANMLTGPIIYNRFDAISTHMDPVWRGHDFGIWANHPDHALGLPFEIPMMGMACFSFLRRAWQPITPLVKGFGSEEWYMAEHTRRNGGIIVCHPKMRWWHRFGRPLGIPFPISVEDKVHNYYAGWLDLYETLSHPRIVEMSRWWCKEPQANGRPVLSEGVLRGIVRGITDEKLVL